MVSLVWEEYYWLLNNQYNIIYKSNSHGNAWAFLMGPSGDKTEKVEKDYCNAQKITMERFICAETTEWGLNPQPPSVLLPLCAHWGPKSPKQACKQIYQTHDKLYILLCKSAYLLSQRWNSLTRRLARGPALWKRIHHLKTLQTWNTWIGALALNEANESYISSHTWSFFFLWAKCIPSRLIMQGKTKQPKFQNTPSINHLSCTSN